MYSLLHANKIFMFIDVIIYRMISSVNINIYKVGQFHNEFKIQGNSHFKAWSAKH